MTKRNLYLVLFAGLVPLAVPVMANAADAASNYYAQQQTDPVHDWSGIYAGVHGGVSSEGFPNPFSSKSGWQFGGQVGANMQSGVIVYGAELDGSHSGGAKHKLGGGAELQRTWSGAAKVRAGMTFDKTLVYGTAGYGVAKFKPKGTVVSDEKWEGGYLLGGGVEQAFAGNISAKVEYNYVDYGDVTSVVSGGARRTDDLSSHTVKAGLNYRF
ncbi:outer membrane protein [Aminobacter aganoensis]|uniref:Outer membrane immunogenic protein n=1 Tax=Aminobacter aganoensis TaxID=83264 RepID=A0A7X0KJN8_9HYPH|nr:outer membrane protein [Aminobacter aganoensis]MBB6353309.1 outer membrane immunogenic protein [Aminobacter aganoensis]